MSLRADGTALVQPLTADEPPPSDGIPQPPAEPLPPLSALLPSCARASPLLAHGVSDILCAYCITSRLYNGEWSDDAPGAAHALLRLSSTLSAAARPGGGAGGAGLPESHAAAVDGVLCRSRSAAGEAQLLRPHCAALASDAAALMGGGRGCVLCALEECRRLLLRAGRGASLRRAERKLFFVMAWANEAGDGALWECADSLLASG